MKLITRNILAQCGTLALVCSPLMGCDSFKTKSKGEKNRQNDQGLSGAWENSCGKADWLGFAHEKSTFKFSALGDYDKITTFYSDEGCQSPTLTLTERGTYAALDKSKDVPEATNINFTLVALDADPQDEQAVKILNAGRFCDHTDWQVGASMDLLGKKCLGKEISSGEVVFDIYQLGKDNSELKLGKNQLMLDKSDAAARPDKLNSDRSFVRS